MGYWNRVKRANAGDATLFTRVEGIVGVMARSVVFGWSES
jgi:hypothetical protein